MKVLTIPITCKCLDETTKKFCKNKGKCAHYEAQKDNLIASMEKELVGLQSLWALINIWRDTPGPALEVCAKINELVLRMSYVPKASNTYSERYYGSGEEKGWWIVYGGYAKREHLAFLGESTEPTEVSKIVDALNGVPQHREAALEVALKALSSISANTFNANILAENALKDIELLTGTKYVAN